METKIVILVVAEAVMVVMLRARQYHHQPSAKLQVSTAESALSVHPNSVPPSCQFVNKIYREYNMYFMLMFVVIVMLVGADS